MRQTTAGAMRTALDTIEAQLKAHMVTGGRLEALKHLFIGPRQLQSTNDVMPCASIIPKSGSIQTYSAAGYMGQQILTMVLEIQIGAPKIMDANIQALANNVLYNDTGDGIVPLFEQLCFCLLFNESQASSVSFTPNIGMNLQSMPSHAYRFIDGDNFMYLVTDVTIEYKFVYEEIAGT